MNKYKNKLTVDILPLNNLLIGFCFQSGVLAEDTSVGIDEFILGLGLINFTFTRKYQAAA